MIKRPTDPNPLFGFTDETHVVHDNAIQRQRKMDGSPFTRYGATDLKAPDMKLKLKDLESTKKSVEATRRDEDENLDPDEVVKAWLLAKR